MARLCLLRRHRRAFRGSESCAADSRPRHGTDLRIWRHWHSPPEIALHAKQIFVVLKQSPRSFVGKLDFCTSAGFLNGNGERAQRGLLGAGPQVVITDMGILKPATRSDELTLVARYENVSVDRIRSATGWPLAVADTIDVVIAPTAEELRVLRD